MGQRRLDLLGAGLITAGLGLVRLLLLLVSLGLRLALDLGLVTSSDLSSGLVDLSTVLLDSRRLLGRVDLLQTRQLRVVDPHLLSGTGGSSHLGLLDSLLLLVHARGVLGIRSSALVSLGLALALLLLGLLDLRCQSRSAVLVNLLGVGVLVLSRVVFRVVSAVTIPSLGQDVGGL